MLDRNIENVYPRMALRHAREDRATLTDGHFKALSKIIISCSEFFGF
jgi:hypothetical protein